MVQKRLGQVIAWIHAGTLSKEPSKHVSTILPRYKIICCRKRLFKRPYAKWLKFCWVHQSHPLGNTSLGFWMCLIEFLKIHIIMLSRQAMMTSSNANIIRGTGPLWGEPPVTGGFPSQRPVTRSWALMFSLIYAWINGWATNLDAGDLRCHGAHYDVTVILI